MRLGHHPVLRKNVARLKDYGWSFDLQVFAPQMEGAAELAESCPDIAFILQHAGMLEDLTPQQAATLGALACRRSPSAATSIPSCPRSAPSFIAPMDHIAAVVGETVAIFGPDRCLFGSNLPIEKLWTSYAELIAAYRKAALSFSPADQDAIFRGTASRVFGRRATRTIESKG